MKRNRLHRICVALSLLLLFSNLVLLHAQTPQETSLSPTADRPRAATVVKGLVILVQFPDVKPPVDRRLVQLRFSRQLNAYLQEMSYDKISLQADVTGKWYTMPKPVTQYRISSRNLEVDRSRVRNLIQDALAAADADVTLSDYSFTVLFMSSAVSDYGMVGLCGYPGMLGWNTGDAIKTRSGQSVKGGVAIFCFQAHLGTLFHDIAHILGGVRDGKRQVPCLYDHDLQAKPGPMRETAVDATVNMGFWDPMSCHYYSRTLPPPGISSWTRLRLGWLPASKLKVVKPDQKTELLLGPLEDTSSAIQAIKIPLSATTYYLIENRQPLGFDRNLPGSGVLIMYADDTVAECRHGRSPVKLMNANPAVPHLEGAAFDLGKQASFQDPTNRIAIQLKEKLGSSYKLLISPL